MPLKEMLCAECNKKFNGRFYKSIVSKYCSRECYSKYFDKGPFYSSCSTCKKAFCKKRKNIKFCSVKCIRGPVDLGALSKEKTGTGFWNVASDEQKIERIKLKFNELVIKNNDCWSWKNKSDNAGYVRIHMGRNKSILAHRASWIIHNGLINNNLWVLHKCDNPICTNPEHLFLGTPKDNTQDCLKKNRKNAPKGIDHYNARLNEEKIKEIRRLIKLGYSQSQLGKQYNVSPSCIQGISEGKTWKWVQI